MRKICEDREKRGERRRMVQGKSKGAGEKKLLPEAAELASDVHVIAMMGDKYGRRNVFFFFSHRVEYTADAA
jgi:hypothetical protein